MQFRGAGQYPEKLTFGWTKFRGAGHGLLLATVFDHNEIKWIGLVWGVLATFPYIAITWWWKIIEIRKSLERCPPDAYSNLEARSVFPWKRAFKTKGDSFRKP